MESAQQIQKKWYNNKTLLILLLFVFPPLGIFGIWKRKGTKDWKKVVYSFFGVISSMFIFLIIFSFFIDKNKFSYDTGMRYYKEGKYTEAINEFELVERESVNYTDAQKKILEIRELLNNKQVEETHQSSLDFSKLSEFQKKWADSIVKSWNGDFIISSELKSTDTIKFELSENATKSFNSNRSQTLPMYISDYRKSIEKRFGDEFDEVETIIDFSPNKKLAQSANSKDYVHPVFMNTGMGIYRGNEYSKEFVGKLVCEFKDESDGMRYYRVSGNDGSIKRIPEYEMKSNYWVKKSDPIYNAHNGLNKCY